MNIRLKRSIVLTNEWIFTQLLWSSSTWQQNQVSDCANGLNEFNVFLFILVFTSSELFLVNALANYHIKFVIRTLPVFFFKAKCWHLHRAIWVLCTKIIIENQWNTLRIRIKLLWVICLSSINIGNFFDHHFNWNSGHTQILINVHNFNRNKLYVHCTWLLDMW